MTAFDEIKPTAWQASVLSVPETFNLLLAGGRGGGKSYGAVLDLLRHVEKYGAQARPLVIRESHKSLEEIADTLDTILNHAYRGGVRHNRADHILRLPNGAKIELGILAEPKHYKQYQGRSFTYLLIEEAGEIVNNKWIDLLRSNLRAPDGIPLREVRTANPGGVSHAHIHQNFIAKAPAWQPYKLDGETWVNCPSVYTDNPHLDGGAYERRLRAACGGDEELLRAWLTGDWNIARGAFFAGSLDETTHMLPDNFAPKLWPQWRPYLAGDWGSAAPAVVYVVGRCPGDVQGIAKDSVVLIDEIATHEADDLNAGLRWPPGKLAEAIQELCGKWGFRPRGVMDDAVGIEDNLLEFFRNDYDIHLQKPEKGRITGWAKMRQAMTNARERNGAPGFFASARCRYFWRTVPFLPRDPNRPEDVLTTAPDHAADAARYGVMHEGWRIQNSCGTHHGMY